MATLAEIGEFEVIRRLEAVRAAGAGVRVAAGDDAAVLEHAAGREIVVTTDTLVEGRHYLPEWCPPRLAGRRLAIVNLSDMAAMGARPRWALRASGVPADRDVDDLVAFETGLAEALAAEGAAIVGGNLSATAGEAWASLTLIGDAEPGRAWSRAGARAGDAILVSGSPGRAGAGYRIVEKLREGARDAEWRAIVAAWVEPPSRVALARALAESDHVRAAIDLSDGLAGDLAHVCRASEAGALIDLDAWPIDPTLTAAAEALGIDATDLLFGPSDDYELLLAVAPDAVAACIAIAQNLGIALTPIGRFTREKEILARNASGERPIDPHGFEHFTP